MTKRIPLFLLALSWSLVTSLAADQRVTYETEIDSDIKSVWDAFTTNSGLKQWMAPHVEVDLAVGGKMKANYSHDGTIGDENTIENTILAFDPERMLALKATGFPKGFPFEDVAKDTWSIFYFSKLPEGRTKITVVGLGYTDDEQSQTMRAFFGKANEASLNSLQNALTDHPDPTAR